MTVREEREVSGEVRVGKLCGCLRREGGKCGGKGRDAVWLSGKRGM